MNSLPPKKKSTTDTAKDFSMDKFNIHAGALLEMLRLLPPFLSQQNAWARLAECHMWTTHALAELQSVKEKEAADKK